MFDREQHTLNLPAVNSITYVLRFLEKLCHNLRSDNLFGNQPFTQTHLPLTATEYSHSHDRYLPGRSWDGTWAARELGSQQHLQGAGGSPHEGLQFQQPLSRVLVFCSLPFHIWVISRALVFCRLNSSGFCCHSRISHSSGPLTLEVAL